MVFIENLLIKITYNEIAMQHQCFRDNVSYGSLTIMENDISMKI